MSICDSYCRGCVYHGTFGGGWMYCNYFYIEDKCRPCPAGSGCTEKKTNKRKSKKKVLEWKKNCEFCGKEFIPLKDMRQRFCCQKCRQEYLKKRRKEKKNENNG